MTVYLFHRLVQALATLLVISVLLFGLVNSTPGGIAAVYAENPYVTDEDLLQLKARLGLDQPLPLRYLHWLEGVLRGDWGRSFYTWRPALVEIQERLPNTLLLMSIALTITLLLAVGLGVLSALRQYSLLDHLVTTLAFAGQALPSFWFGLILILVFHVSLRRPDGAPLLPGMGVSTLGAPFSLGDRIEHLVLPVGLLVLVSIGSYLRFMRAAMLDVIGQEYVRAAHARGLSSRRVIYKHALRNALIPLVTLIALRLPALFNGALFVETVFAWPGMGRLYYDAATLGDYPVVMAVLIINCVLVILANLLADVTYSSIDPRMRLA